MSAPLRIGARVHNGRGAHDVTLRTNEQARSLEIAPRATGFGSSANGGELLALALATCYCNDLYRESEREGVPVDGVTVDVDTEFGGAGEPARRITYRVRVRSEAPEDAVRRLAEHTDRVAEVHNTLRLGMPVTLERVDVERVTA